MTAKTSRPGFPAVASTLICRSLAHPGRALAAALLCVLLTRSAPAWADSGIPFLELGLHHLLLVSLIVVWLEAWMLRGMLKLGFGAAALTALLTNLLSYLAGLPLLWAMSNSGPLFDKINQYQNLALSAALVLTLFALTCLVEAPLLWLAVRFIRRRVRPGKLGQSRSIEPGGAADDPSWRQILRVCLSVNFVSYLVLVPMMGPFSFFPNYGIRALFRG